MAKEDILINILLDRSGSMGGLETDVIGHYNSYIEEQSKLPGKATVSLVLFDNQYEEVYINKDIQDVPPLDNGTYFVRGNTAYVDALGRLIKTVEALPKLPKKVIFVVNTDGLENASREYTPEQVKETIERLTKKKKWQFVFIGAGIDALKVGASLGIRNTFAAASGPQGMSVSYNNLGTTSTAYRSGITNSMDMNQTPKTPATPRK